MKKQYKFLDIFKLIFAIGIVAIHCSVFQNNDNIAIYIILKDICRLGVPFFFTVSGFFFYNKLIKSENIKDSVKKYVKRLIIPFIFWMILNFPYNFCVQYKNSSNIIITFIKIIRGIIFYPWGAMWYIYALIIAVLCIIPFYKRKKLKEIVVTGCILYLFALICNNYYFLIENTIIQPIVDMYLKITTSARNGIFEGIYFVSVGMYLCEITNENRINNKLNNVVFIISYILLIIESLLIKNFTHKDDESLFIMYIIVIPSLVLFLMQFDCKLNTTKIRNLSTGIYFSHRFVITCLQVIAILLGFKFNPVILFICTVISCIIVLLLLYKIDNEKLNMVIK